MTIYGQTLGVFKREINECIRNEERTKLHKIKIVVFWLYKYGAMTRISSPITSLWRHNDVIRDEIRVIAPHMLKPKIYNFDFMQFGFFSFANTFIVFAFKVAEHSFKVPMPNSPLLLSHLCFGAHVLQESRLTTEIFILAFWQGCVPLPWQRGWLKTRVKRWFLFI